MMTMRWCVFVNLSVLCSGRCSQEELRAAVRKIDPNKSPEDVDALMAATKRDAEAAADRRVAAAKLDAQAEADRRVEAVKRDAEATAERRVAKEAARAQKAEEEYAKIEAGINATKAALEERFDLAKADADAKEAERARVASEAKEEERERKLILEQEAKEAEEARKAEGEAKAAAEKARKAEADKKKAIADMAVLAAAQKKAEEAARVVREAEKEEAAAIEDARNQMEAEALRAEAEEAEKRAALREAEAAKIEKENDMVTMYAPGEEKDQDPTDGAAAPNGSSDAAAPSAEAAAEAKATLAREKEQAEAIQAAMEWQSRETIVPRDGVCEGSELSSALRSVVITTKDGKCADSRKWTMLDPSVNMKLFDDEAAESLVRENYPDLLATYQGLAHGVERADLFRYLAIHLDGGIYADCDVEPNACVSKWLKEYEWFEGREGLHINSSVPLLVVGVEFDAEGGWVLESVLNNGTAKSKGAPTHTSRIQLCQWLFAATAPRHPALVSVMGEVQARVKSYPDNMNLITDRTGPVAWTAGVMRYIRRYNVSGEDLLPVRKLDHHGQLFRMREPSGVESQVLLLPYRAFAYPGAHGPGVFEEPSRQKLVHHMFKGSWKPSLRHKVTDLMGFADRQSKKGHKI